MRFMEANEVRNVLRILIVMSAIMGLLVVQGVGTNAGVLTSSARH